jgi:hypothetical protein
MLPNKISRYHWFSQDPFVTYDSWTSYERTSTTIGYPNTTGAATKPPHCTSTHTPITTTQTPSLVAVVVVVIDRNKNIWLLVPEKTYDDDVVVVIGGGGAAAE